MILKGPNYSIILRNAPVFAVTNYPRIFERDATAICSHLPGAPSTEECPCSAVIHGLSKEWWEGATEFLGPFNGKYFMPIAPTYPPAFDKGLKAVKEVLKEKDATDHPIYKGVAKALKHKTVEKAVERLVDLCTNIKAKDEDTFLERLVEAASILGTFVVGPAFPLVVQYEIMHPTISNLYVGMIALGYLEGADAEKLGVNVTVPVVPRAIYEPDVSSAVLPFAVRKVRAEMDVEDLERGGLLEAFKDDEEVDRVLLKAEGNKEEKRIKLSMFDVYGVLYNVDENYYQPLSEIAEDLEHLYPLDALNKL